MVDLVLIGERPTRKIGLVQDARLRKLILYCWDDVPKVRPDAKHIVNQICVTESVSVSRAPLLYSTLLKCCCRTFFDLYRVTSTTLVLVLHSTLLLPYPDLLLPCQLTTRLHPTAAKRHFLKIIESRVSFGRIQQLCIL
jgi:hypothetical protein